MPKIKKLQYFTKSRIKRRILKLFFSPKVYFPFILKRLGLFRSSKIKEVVLFFGRKIYVRTGDIIGVDLIDIGRFLIEPEVKLTKFLLKI